MRPPRVYSRQFLHFEDTHLAGTVQPNIMARRNRLRKQVVHHGRSMPPTAGRSTARPSHTRRRYPGLGFGRPERKLRPLLLGSNSYNVPQFGKFPAPALGRHFRTIAGRSSGRSGRGRAIRPVDRRPHRDAHRPLPLHQWRCRSRPPAPPAGAGRCRGRRGRYGHSRRPAIDRPAGRAARAPRGW